MRFSLLRVQTISPDTIQISSDKISEHSGYQNFPPDVVQNIIGYRKVKFWLPPADPGKMEGSRPCPFFVFSLVFSSKRIQKFNKRIKILHCRKFTGLKEAQFYAKTFTIRLRKEA
jgi:hypothetical protein